MNEHANEHECSLCGLPVDLTRAKTDEGGQPVHESCYASVLLDGLVKVRTYDGPERRRSRWPSEDA
jgi:hypothetical protein